MVNQEVACPDGHLNGTGARFCRTCGSPIGRVNSESTKAASERKGGGEAEAGMVTVEATPPRLSTAPPAQHFVYSEGKATGGQDPVTPADQVAFNGGAAGHGVAPVQKSMMQTPVAHKASHTGIVAAITVVVVLVLGAVTAVTAVVLKKHRDHTSSYTLGPRGTSGSAKTGGGGSGNRASGNGPGSSGANNSSPVTTTTLAANLTPVNIASVSTALDIGQIQNTFESYFGGINTRNWNQAYADYSPSYQANNSEHLFESTATTSTDTNVAITSVTVNPDQSVTTNVAFTSGQAAAFGRDGETCTDWTLAYQLVPSNGAAGTTGYVIEGAQNIGPGAVACPAS